jgi:hypothetical protein
MVAASASEPAAHPEAASARFLRYAPEASPEPAAPSQSTARPGAGSRPVLVERESAAGVAVEATAVAQVEASVEAAAEEPTAAQPLLAEAALAAPPASRTFPRSAAEAKALGLSPQRPRAPAPAANPYLSLTPTSPANLPRIRHRPAIAARSHHPLSAEALHANDATQAVLSQHRIHPRPTPPRHPAYRLQ